jgi:hypothetical protein
MVFQVAQSFLGMVFQVAQSFEVGSEGTGFFLHPLGCAIV